ncbi:hypothetical protein V1282_000505 [Nitrobacteraceae bacterium AZCC 2146]
MAAAAPPIYRCPPLKSLADPGSYLFTPFNMMYII